MVAPTRTPQARGVKCSLCKKILLTATWLDQTKPARNVEDAQQVLDLMKEHNSTDCPCIPKNIENLLVGSTHFEIHRLLSTRLELNINKKHSEYISKCRMKVMNQPSKRQVVINDLQDTQDVTRFKLFPEDLDQKYCDMSTKQLRHLCSAIDYWDSAMKDQANPFNSKLALRLGLTHHVIYACYLFRYYRILIYQLISSNLLLNLFKSVEGVTEHATIHAHFLVIRTLIDCNQTQMAKQYLKQAMKLSGYQDKQHYESILLACVECELNLLDGTAGFSILDELAELAIIQEGDKLQHYYARALALSVLLRYIHHYPARSDVCFELYSLFRLISAIIRRCYESSFELVLQGDMAPSKNASQMNQTNHEIPSHSWIRFAACDFAFSTFDVVCKFYIRAGHPESLELLYNGLSLVSHRTNGHYWQAKMASLGAIMDFLCEKKDHSEKKLKIIPRLIGFVDDVILMNLIRLEFDVTSISIIDKVATKIEVFDDLSLRLKRLNSIMSDKISQIELSDGKNSTKLQYNNSMNDCSLMTNFHLRQIILDLKLLKVKAKLIMSDYQGAKELISNLGEQIKILNIKSFNYCECQTLLEMMLTVAHIGESELSMLESAMQSRLFIQSGGSISNLENQLSSLTIKDEITNVARNDRKRFSKANRTKKSQKTLGRHKGLYEVASTSEENLQSLPNIAYFDTLEAIKNFSILTTEEKVACYLRNSEPYPDYLLYRHAHELMFTFRLQDEVKNHDQLLYHFSESSSSNTMRYRWMMFEEQQACPFDDHKPMKSLGSLKQLSFCSVLANQDKTIRHFVRSIPDGYRVVQMKHIISRDFTTEHLLLVCFDNDLEPIYAHVAKPLSSDDFFEDAEARKKDDSKSLALPNRFSNKIEEAKKTLFLTNSRVRSEKRQKLESEIGVILHDFENEWLGAFRFLLCGKVLDLNYRNFIDNLAKELDSFLVRDCLQCNSIPALKLLLDNALVLSRDEFCQVLSSLYGCSETSDQIRTCSNKWLKSLEEFISNQQPGMSRSAYNESLQRGQLGLILDGNLENLPFESLPIVRVNSQGTFRVPSLRLFSIFIGREGGGAINQTPRVDVNQLAYVLDPANNLAKTRERFEAKLRSKKNWIGSIAEAPQTDLLESWLTEKQIYLFIGHGAGMAYYNKLRKGRGIGAMPYIKPVFIIMGCSSGRVASQSSRFESFGVNWLSLMRGSPSYIGLLWDVTDTDIDRFLDNFLLNWIQSNNWPTKSTGDIHTKHARLSSTESVAKARHVCQLKLLVGSTPVVYGLPVWTNTE